MNTNVSLQDLTPFGPVTVMGAYITGDEIIGYSPTYVPDTLAPAAPTNLTVQ